MQLRQFEIRNRHEKRMPSTLRMPKSAPSGFAISLHGLGGWRDQSIVTAAADALVKKGYAVLTFEAADGALAPDAQPISSTTTGFLEDLEDVIEFARENDWYAQPFVLAGHSLGGLVAAEYAKKHPENVARLILLAPAISWKFYTRFVIPLGIWWFLTGKRKSPAPKGIEYFLGRPWLVDFIGYDSYRSAPSVTVQTLVISAERDNLVGTPAKQAQYAKAFAHATHVVIPGATHTFWKHEQEAADTITQWLT